MENAFFSRFPGFQPNASFSAAEEFSRLAHHMNWTASSKRYRQELAKFASAEFAHYYNIGNKLQNYQALCQELQIEGSFASITYQAALKEYTKDTQKIFPKLAAKADGFLKDLLRRLS
ncbi:hypothetical protein BDV12DRAFT_191666 [Aspergillus spectabilis]